VKRIVFAGLVALLVVPVEAGAQQAPPAPAPQAAPAPPTPPTPPAGFRPVVPLIPLRVQVVISKYKDEKKISSVPYTLAVNANDSSGNRFSELSSAISVLIPMVTVNEKTTGPVYKDDGTTIRCRADSMDGGRFKVDLNVEDQSIYTDAKLPADGARGPWLQAFRSSQALILKDGQSTEYTTATEQVSGQVTRVSVTLTVVK